MLASSHEGAADLGYAHLQGLSRVQTTDQSAVALCVVFGLTHALFEKTVAQSDLTQTTAKGSPISAAPESAESVSGWQREGKQNGSQGKRINCIA